jgi:IS30 family transposase
MGKMDKKTLAGITDKRKLSRLSPHARLIRELRRSGVTFGGIARFLSEKKQVTVNPSTVFYFLKRQGREDAGPNKTKPCREEPHKQTATLLVPAAQAVPPPTSAGRGAPSDEVQRRIEALKHRPPKQEPAENAFDFNEERPLTIVTDKKGT